MITLSAWAFMDVFTFLLLLQLLFFTHRTAGDTPTVKLRKFIMLMLVLVVADGLSRIVPEGPHYELKLLMMQLSNFLIFALDPFGIILSLDYVNCWIKSDTDIRYRNLFWTVMFFYCCLNLILSSFDATMNSHLFYGYNAISKEYVRGIFFYHRAAASISFCIALAYYVFVYRRFMLEKFWMPLLSYPIGLLVFGLAQTALEGMQLEYAGVVFAMQFVFNFVQNASVNEDYLTGTSSKKILQFNLQNRVAWSNETRTFTFFIMDLDHFKEINDIYGHTVGDEALITMSKILKNVFRRSSDIISRFGGDEFCVIADVKTEEGVKKLLSEVQTLVDKFNAENKKKATPYELKISVGYQIYKKSSGMDAEQLFAAVDKQMYEIKEAHHQAHPGKRDVKRRESDNCSEKEIA